MRKILPTIPVLILLLLIAFTSLGQRKSMPWTTNSEKARELALKGNEHFKNIEFALAYQYYKGAVELDQDFTNALVMLANLTTDESKKMYTGKALKSVTNKSEGEKLFASTIAPGNTPDGNRKTWSELHKMFPDGTLIGMLYVFSLQTPAEQFPVVESFIKKNPKDAAFYNLMGYIHLSHQKDTALAKTYFEKYIELYPDGYNPYDSMAEFYFITGDLANSEKYYKLTQEKYPFSINASDKLKDLKAAKDKLAKTAAEKK